MRPDSLVTLLLLVTSLWSAQAAILRPEWFPYFREDLQGRGLQNVMDYLKGGSPIPARQQRQNPNPDEMCPPDIPRYECYHEMMAVWTRLLNKHKRSGDSSLLQEPSLQSDSHFSQE